MNKRFKVTVTEIGTKFETQRTWVQLDQAGKMGWSPPVETTAEYRIDRYEQSVDELDIQAVVRAVNGGAS